ncbi:MAG: DUF1697 domain-containing protein [Steroidobacteraceae bacterium]
MAECIALLRGINVGRAKRIAMADLRNLIEGLGHENVRTLLNSGNVLFRCARPNTARLALAIQAAVLDKCGLSAPVTVLTAATLAAVIRENTLLKIAKDPARHLVAFVAQPSSLLPLGTLLKESWTPEALAIGSNAAYLWCAGGVLDSKLLQMFARRAGETITTRNWATVLKLQQASEMDA